MRYLCIYLAIITCIYFVPVAINISKAQEEMTINDIAPSESTISMFSYGAFVHRSGKESFTLEDLEKRKEFARVLAQQFMISIFVSSIYFFWMRKQLLSSIDKLDIENLTPSDYCLQGYYMNFEDYKPQAMEQEIRNFFNEEYEGLGDKIEYVNPAYDIGSYYELSEKMRILSKELQIV